MQLYSSPCSRAGQWQGAHPAAPRAVGGCFWSDGRWQISLSEARFAAFMACRTEGSKSLGVFIMCSPSMKHERQMSQKISSEI